MATHQHLPANANVGRFLFLMRCLAAGLHGDLWGQRYGLLLKRDGVIVGEVSSATPMDSQPCRGVQALAYLPGQTHPLTSLDLATDLDVNHAKECGGQPLVDRLVISGAMIPVRYSKAELTSSDLSPVPMIRFLFQNIVCHQQAAHLPQPQS